VNIRVAVDLSAPPEVVWDDLRHIARHSEWMHDAVAIRFTSESHEGVGAAFDCDTKVGPIRLTDRMEVTRWDAPQAMGIRHVGLVTGEGEFALAPHESGTRFSWTERLSFPWWMGGPVGAWLARPVLRRIWRRNLAALAARF
jgi:hypothetical protein